VSADARDRSRRIERDSCGDPFERPRNFRRSDRPIADAPMALQPPKHGAFSDIRCFEPLLGKRSNYHSLSI
jgi:hypothetical protein